MIHKRDSPETARCQSRARRWPKLREKSVGISRGASSAARSHRHISTLKRQRFVETRIVEPDSPNIESCCVVRGGWCTACQKGSPCGSKHIKRENTSVKNETSYYDVQAPTPVHRCAKADTTATTVVYCTVDRVYLQIYCGSRGFHPSSPPLLSAPTLLYCPLGTFLHP